MQYNAIQWKFKIEIIYYINSYNYINSYSDIKWKN